MKTKEQLNALKAEVGTMNKMFSELTENDFEQVSGGIGAVLVAPYKLWQ